MYSKNDNIKIMINNGADQVAKELFDSLNNRYQNNLESMKGSDFVFDCVHFLYHKCHEINPNLGGSYMDSSDWIKHKKATINSINKKDNKWFQYAVTVALNHEEIRRHSEKIIKIKSFLNEYDWEGMNFPSERDDWKKFEKNKITIALDVFYAKKKNISCLCFKT